VHDLASVFNVAVGVVVLTPGFPGAFRAARDPLFVQGLQRGKYDTAVNADFGIDLHF
jgi:hypothetical protein